MNDTIANLSDDVAKSILKDIAGTLESDVDIRDSDLPALREALAGTFGTDTPEAQVSEGELARMTLGLLAEDAKLESSIMELIENPVDTRGIITTALVVAAIVAALQTHIKIEKDKNDKYSILVEKKPTSEALITSIVQPLLKILPGQMFQRH